LPAVLVEGESEATAEGRAQVGRRGLGGPVEHGAQGTTLIADASAIQAGAQTVEAGRVQVVGGGEVTNQMPGTISLPKVVEASGETREGGLEVLADLDAEHDRLADQLAALANEQLQGRPGFVQAVLDQSEAVDGSRVNGDEVGIVGLVTRVAWLAQPAGGEGMDDARLEARGGEGAADGVMVAAGPLDGDELVAEVMRAQRLAQVRDGGVESSAVMLDDGGWNEDGAEEIGEHPLGACLGTVDADDAEVLGAHLLDPGMEGATRLLHDIGTARVGAPTGVRTGHRNCLQRRGKGTPRFSPMAVQSHSF